jgi:hypothetical protein
LIAVFINFLIIFSKKKANTHPSRARKIKAEVEEETKQIIKIKCDKQEKKHLMNN